MKRSRLMCALALVTLAGGLTGCGSGDERLDAVRDDPSPNLDTLHQRPADIDNAVTLTFDENWRMFTQDLGRAFYWDRPSRLTREPVPRP